MKPNQEIRKTFLFFAVFIVALIYILFRFFFTLPLHHGLVSVIFGVLLWIAEAIAVVEAFSHFNNARLVKLPEMPDIPQEMYPDIDILICTHSESVDLLYKTVNGCLYMQYPDEQKKHIFVCDDNQREEVRAFCEKMGVGYLGVSDNKYAKAGNVNYALGCTSSMLVAIFDADMIPTSKFLLEMVPYFFRREMIKEDGEWRVRTEEDEPCDEKEFGYVQSHQSFYNPDMFQRNLHMEKKAPNEQDYFYRSVNVARTHTGSAAFAGSNTVFLRKALEEIGGLATYSITEDLATSIPILAKGYAAVALDKELAHGLSPDDAGSMIKQRKRWSRGSAQVIPHFRFLRSKLPLRSKWNFFVSFVYWWTFLRRLIFIVCPLLFGLFRISVADVTLPVLLAIWGPYFLVYSLGLRHISGKTTSAFWSTIVDTIQFPYLLWPIVAGTLNIPEKKFWVTPKEGIAGKNSGLKLAIPHMVLLVLSVISIVNCVRFVRSDPATTNSAIIVLFWLIYNLLALVFSVIYYIGEYNDDAIEVRIPICVTYEDRSVQDETRQIIISDTVEMTVHKLQDDALMVRIDKDEVLPIGAVLRISIGDNGYAAEMSGKIYSIKNSGRDWDCWIKITQIDEKSRKEYLQILYDRDHPFSRTVNASFSAIVGVAIRKLTNRYQNTGSFQAAYKDMESARSGKLTVKHFNDEYLICKRAKKLPEYMAVRVAENLGFLCKRGEPGENGSEVKYLIAQKMNGLVSTE